MLFTSLSKSRRAVLDALKDGPLTGREIHLATGGRLGSGTIYVLLSRMEDEGLIASERLPDKQRLYRAKENPRS